MNQRSLHAVTKLYYRSMSCFAMISPTGPACSAKIFPTGSSCTMWAWVNHHAIFHSYEQDTQPIVFLISKQAALYRAHGSTCSPRVSTPKIRFLAESNITCPTTALIPIWSNHISTDERPQHSHKDTSQTQHYKDGRLV
jgi:hypothetical protein